MTRDAGATPTRPIGVVHLLPVGWPQPAGAERQLQTLLDPLGRRGVRSIIIARRLPGQPPCERLADATVYRPRLLPGRVLGSLSLTVASLVLLVRLRRHIDVIVAYSPFSPLTIGALAAWLLGRTLAVKILGGGPSGELARLGRTRGAALRRWVLRRAADRVVAVSREIEDELQAAGVRPGRIVRISNGVDTRYFRPPTPEERTEERQRLGCGSRRVVVYVGRLAPEKGVAVLLDAWPAVREALPDALLLVVGDGRCRQAYEARLAAGADSGAAPLVRFVGAVDDPRPYLWAADCLVLPSLAEGLPNALLEATATGLPCVATDVGGSSDVLLDGVGGWVVPPNDPAALAASTIAALTDGDRMVRGMAAQAGTVRARSIETTADQWTALYRRLAGGRV